MLLLFASLLSFVLEDVAWQSASAPTLPSSFATPQKEPCRRGSDIEKQGVEGQGGIVVGPAGQEGKEEGEEEERRGEDKTTKPSADRQDALAPQPTNPLLYPYPKGRDPKLLSPPSACLGLSFPEYRIPMLLSFICCSPFDGEVDWLAHEKCGLRVRLVRPVNPLHLDRGLCSTSSAPVFPTAAGSHDRMPTPWDQVMPDYGIAGPVAVVVKDQTADSVMRCGYCPRSRV
ncbi:hypothetical protein BKA80DRAFT_323762 [Phyllosticta citrichinensis]